MPDDARITAQTGQSACESRVNSREQLLHLLTEAAEFEHNLLCCYLYAAFSLKRDADSGLNAEELEAVGRWRDAIMGVAIEEMVHLALVANLTVAIGARPHFDRPNLPVAPGYHPADIVVELAPFDLATLDHFIYLERPLGVSLHDGAGFEPQARFARGERRETLMPHAYDYETIAELYAGIRDGFSRLAQIAERPLFIGAPTMQLSPAVVSLPGLIAITDVDSALRAIDTIVLQGEGAPGEAEKCHYATFKSVKTEYVALLGKRSQFAPAWPAARNPVMRRPVDSENRIYVDEPHAARVLDVANAVYNHMLRLLAQAYGRALRTVEVQRQMLETAMQLMSVLAPVSEYLATLPASPSRPGVNAGVTFTMLRSTEPWLENPDERPLLAERLQELARGMAGVSAGVPTLERASAQLGKLAQTFFSPLS